LTKDLFKGIFTHMTTISISQLKTNPSAMITQSLDYPVAVQNRNKTQAYLIGSKLFEKIIEALEDQIDRKIIEKTDFSKGQDLETVEKNLGL